MESETQMIKKSELLMGRDISFSSEYTQEISDNLDKLLVQLNIVRDLYGKPMYVSSGWRPSSVNTSVGGSKKSNHMIGLACDFKDTDRQLTEWCLKNIQKLTELGLYMESPDSTPTWVHLQLKAPKSGNNPFIP